MWVCEGAKTQWGSNPKPKKIFISQKGWQKVIRRLKVYKFGNFGNFPNCKWEFKMPERIRVCIWPQESGKCCHRCHLFYAKATHSLSTERRECLKPALNEEVWSLCDLEPTSSDYLFGENMNESLKLAIYYKLSQNLVSTKSRNKVAGPSSRAGFKRWPDHEAGNSFLLGPSNL